MFSIYDKNLEILLIGGRAYDYVKELSDIDLHDSLMGYVSWNNPLKIKKLKTVNYDKEIKILEAEQLFRKTNKKIKAQYER